MSDTPKKPANPANPATPAERAARAAAARDRLYAELREPAQVRQESGTGPAKPAKPPAPDLAERIAAAKRESAAIEAEIQGGLDYPEAEEPDEAAFADDDLFRRFDDIREEMHQRFYEEPKPNGQWTNGEDRSAKQGYVGPKVIDFAESLHIPTQPPTWLDDHKLMRKNTGFQLNGDGGVGKTEISLQMAIGITGTGTLFNRQVDRGSCLFVSFEEPENDIRHRIDHLCHAFNIPSADVKNLYILDLTHERDPWMFKEKDRLLRPTDRWTWLLKQFEQIKPTFVVMDNKARFFGANQNDSMMSTDYAHHIEMACYDLDTTIMPLAHISLNQLQSGRGDSGSVAAGNAFRSRLLFTHSNEEHKPGEADDKRKLVVMKANASKTGYSIDFEWDKGLHYQRCLYRPESADAGIGAGSKAERVFIDLLKVRIDTNRPVSASENSQNYAPKVFFKNKDGRQGVNQREFEYVMELLLKRGTIRQVEYKVSGHVRMRLDFNL